jgi:hypothetical protein
MPPELTGGLGPEGVKALRQFVEDGGTLVFLNRASDFAIEQFKLPLRDVVAGLPKTQFYVPGSILRLELDITNPIARGMPEESIAWAEDSPVFEVVHDSNSPVPGNVHIIGWYPRDKDPLLSGWLLGGERIKGKAALVEVTMGKGRIILLASAPNTAAVKGNLSLCSLTHFSANDPLYVTPFDHGALGNSSEGRQAYLANSVAGLLMAFLESGGKTALP